METYYFTFRQIDFDKTNHKPLRDCWIEITAESRLRALDKMIKLYGENWANQYTKEEFDPKYFPGGCYAKYRCK